MGFKAPWRVAVLAYLLITLVASAGLREDELHCEAGLRKIDECCTDVDLGVFDCEYDDGCGTIEYPLITKNTAECLNALSCTEVAERDICARIVAAQQAQNLQGASNAPAQGVCP